MSRSHPALVAALALSAACAGPTAESEDCWWIGSISSLTGALAPLGLTMENAAKLAVQDLNSTGITIGGKNLCIATGDDRTQPERAERIVEAMVERYDIRAVNGAVASSATLQAARAAKDHQMAIISGASSSPELSKDPDIYRTAPSDALQGVALAGVATDRGVTRIATIFVDNAYGTALRDRFRTAFEALGGEVVREVPYLDAQSSYVTVIAEALGDPAPEAVLLIAYPVDAALLVRDWRTSGIAQHVRWFGAESLKDASFVALAGDGVPEFEGTAPSPSSPYFAAFERRYAEAYGGERPGTFAPYQYDAVVLIGLAMARAGDDPRPLDIRGLLPELSRRPGRKVGPSDLREAMQMAADGADLDYEGVSGNVDLDGNGDIVSGFRSWSIPRGGGAVAEGSTCFACQAAGGLVSCAEEACNETP